MSKYIIEGGAKLKGTIKISGNKNAVLPCIAASLLTNKEVTLKNVPNIADVSVLVEILQTLGVEVKRVDHELLIKVEKISSYKLPENLVSKLRASILLVGPLLSRLGKVEFTHPGGDIIGKRSIETHIKGFEKLGFKVKENDTYFYAQGQICDEDCEIFLEEASCTAAENLIMAGALSEYQLTLKNCPEEPQIVDLCKLLERMGVKIEGIGTSTLKIRGKKNLNGATYSIDRDYIELGTYAVASAITKGEIEFENCKLSDLEPILIPLRKMGIEFLEKNNLVKVKAIELISIDKLHTNIWPGFPTDLMSALIVLATQAKGVSLLHDWMYESRMFFVDKLISMGANITIADPHRVLVYGPTKLKGSELETPDIRAGMALVLAALVAKGTSIINRAELIERGYEDVVGNLTKLGAKIQRVE